jgi:glycosyltransferase involved in cell wall biosynthesis
VKNGATAIFFDRLGPYHWARLQAAARVFRVVAIETCAVTRDYQWERIEEPRAFDRVTLFDGVSGGRKLKRGLLREKIANALREVDPAVALIPGWATPASLTALEWCLRNQRPAVVMSESNAFDAKRYALAELIKRIVVSLFSAGLAGGQLQKEYLITLGLPRNRVFTGYDVVDNDYFATNAARVRDNQTVFRRELSLPENYFLASARFVPKKNLRRLMEAYVFYRSLAGPKYWKLVLLGDGPLRPELLTLRHELDLDNDCVMRGFIQYQDLPAYYALANAFVHASTTEQWGLVVNEAMATGLPVIVSNRCGCAPDLVAEGKNGFTFNPESVEGLGNLMVEMSRLSGRHLEEMRAESRRIVAGFTPTHFATAAQQAIDVAKTAPIYRPTLFSSLLLKALIYR